MSNITRGIVHITVDKNARLSLWDSRESAVAVSDEVALQLQLTDEQLILIGHAQTLAQFNNQDHSNQTKEWSKR